MSRKKKTKGSSGRACLFLLDMVIVGFSPFFMEPVIMYTVLAIVVVGVLILLGVTNTTPLGRALRAGYDLVMSWFKGAETKASATNTVAQYQVAIDEQRKQLSTGKQGLKTYDKLIADTTELLHNAEEDRRKLDARVQLYVDEEAAASKVGDTVTATAKSTKANELDLQLTEAEAEVKKLETQIKDYQQSYNESLRMMQDADSAIRESEKDAVQMGAELELSEADKAARASLANINPQIIGSISSKLQQKRAAVKSAIQANRSDNKVEHDLNKSYFDEKDEEARIAAKTSSARLAARRAAAVSQ